MKDLQPLKYYEKSTMQYWIEHKNLFGLALLCKLFVIINKNYPSFLIRPIGSKEFIKWEDFIIQGNYLDYFTIRFNVYCMLENDLEFQIFNDCLTINVEGTCTCIEFNFQPIVDVFKYIELDNDFNETIVEEDQKEAAKLNRKILAQFLKDLEMYIGSISEISGGVIDMKYLSKNGVDEKAVQCNFES